MQMYKFYSEIANLPPAFFALFLASFLNCNILGGVFNIFKNPHILWLEICNISAQPKII